MELAVIIERLLFQHTGLFYGIPDGIKYVSRATPECRTFYYARYRRYGKSGLVSLYSRGIRIPHLAPNHMAPWARCVH